jgi:hypothetical protein
VPIFPRRIVGSADLELDRDIVIVIVAVGRAPAPRCATSS